MNLIKELVHENHQTMVLVTHDESVAKYADCVIRMTDGEITDITN